MDVKYQIVTTHYIVCAGVQSRVLQMMVPKSNVVNDSLPIQIRLPQLYLCTQCNQPITSKQSKELSNMEHT